jgi:hypothetical protein
VVVIMVVIVVMIVIVVMQLQPEHHGLAVTLDPVKLLGTSFGHVGLEMSFGLGVSFGHVDLGMSFMHVRRPAAWTIGQGSCGQDRGGPDRRDRDGGLQ